MGQRLLWKDIYNKVKEFKEEYGRWPRHDSYEEELSLYHWCSAQRADRARLYCNPEKMRLLKEIDFPFVIIRTDYHHDSEEEQLRWLDMYRELVGFLNEFRRLPRAIENTVLYRWYKYNLDKLDKGQLCESKMVLMTRIKTGLDRLKEAKK